MRKANARAAFVARLRGSACQVACAVLLIGCVEPRNTNEDSQTPAHGLHVETEGELVTVLAREASLKDIVTEVARQNGLVLVSDDLLEAHVTMELRRLPLSQVLERLLRDRSFIHQAVQGSLGGSKAREMRRGTLWVFSAGHREATDIFSSSAASRDEGAKLRLDTISALADEGGDHAVAILTAVVVGDGDSAVREEAVAALGDLGGEAAIHGLKQALTDPDYHVREGAIEALADTGGDASALALSAALNDPDVSLREEAVDALGEIGGRSAVRLLRLAARDEHSSVRQGAAEYLGELSEEGQF